MPSWLSRSVYYIALVYALRVFGFMVILPALSLHPEYYQGGDMVHLGFAIGIYGLMQALCQLPMGTLSDRLGRKPVVLGGLVVLIIGSLMAAMAEHVVWLIVARALQGMGAVGSTLSAWSMDVTEAQHRPKVMAVIGVGIGASFVLSVALGPFLAHHLGLAGLFLLTALLGVLAFLVVQLFLDPPKQVSPNLPVLQSVVHLVKDKGLIRLNAGACSLHAIYTMLFMVIAPAFRLHVSEASVGHWFLGILFVALAAALMAIRKTNTLTNRRLIIQGAVLALAVNAAVGFAVFDAFWGLVVFLTVLWAAFTLLEALLPAMVADWANSNRKGSAMGLYAMSQYFGLYVGGVLGGFVQSAFGLGGIMITACMLSLVWLWGMHTMPNK